MANLSRDEKDIYDAALQEKRDRIGRASFYRNEGEASGRALGRAEGMAEGEARGRALGRAEGEAEGEIKGRAEGIEETASKMLEEGLEEALICKLTGLNAGDISRIRAKKR